ncbi:MAG: cytidine deaminase, partial [Bifidobacteriaceae bacterium]|nr:cytidine deaminase [Bifidobacteriaceae bacterium]
MTQASWEPLLQLARQAAGRASAPYSGYAVGAAAETAGAPDAVRLLSGCNVENASYGLTLCAECSLVSALHGSGGGRLARFVCVAARALSQPELTLPCGRCRQLLW